MSRAINGCCLCGEVNFQIVTSAENPGMLAPFELCHCNRCRKSSGTAFVAGIRVRTDAFSFLSGEGLIDTFEAPIVNAPPPYTTAFCRRCGSPVPNPDMDSEYFEIAAGLLDDDPGVMPDKHIYVEFKSSWYGIIDDLPKFTAAQIRQHRQSGD